MREGRRDGGRREEGREGEGGREGVRKREGVKERERIREMEVQRDREGGRGRGADGLEVDGASHLKSNVIVIAVEDVGDRKSILC